MHAQSVTCAGYVTPRALPIIYAAAGIVSMPKLAVMAACTDVRQPEAGHKRNKVFVKMRVQCGRKQRTFGGGAGVFHQSVVWASFISDLADGG